MARITASTKRPLTADDLFRIELVSDPHVSPDGRHVAWVQTRLNKEKDIYESAIWIAEATGGNARQLTSGTHRDQSPQWSPDGFTIAFTSNRPNEVPLAAKADSDPKSDETDRRDQNGKPASQVWTIRIDGGEATQQSNHPNGASDPAWSPDGSTIAFVGRDDVAEGDAFDAATSIGPIADERIVRDISYRFDGQGFLDRYTHIWTTVAGTGTSTQLTVGDANDGSPAWSPDGSSIAFTSNRSSDRKRFWNRKAVHLIRIGDGAITPLTPDDAQFSDPTWSPSGDRLALIGHLGTGSATNDDIWTVSVDGHDLVNHSQGSDISFGDSGMSDVHMSSDQGPRWYNDSTLLALASRGGETQVFRVSTGKHSVVQVTIGNHRISGFSPLGDKLAIIRGTTARPFALEIWSGNGPETVVSTANDAFLSEVDLIEAQEIPVTSADGTPIQTWLIPPHGFDRKSAARHPLILQIHGGPHSMYGHALFHEMQLMAARGYAVVFSNPRGSAGYGQDFTACTKGIWGEADMPDVIAAVEAVAALPWIDEHRIGITGGSYGGYLTNWVIGHDNRFKAAVTQRCVSNFYSFFGTSDIGTTFGVNEFDGLPWTDAEKLLRHSPISHVGSIDTPLLILHSEQDLRCPIEQAEQMFAALKYQEKEVSFVRIPGEGHELSRSGTPSRRLARLHHLIGWFDRHL